MVGFEALWNVVVDLIVQIIENGANQIILSRGRNLKYKIHVIQVAHVDDLGTMVY